VSGRWAIEGLAMIRILAIIFFTCGIASAKDFNIQDFGGVGDGKTINTNAFHAVIQACAATGGRVVIPQGTFLTGPIQLMSNVDLHVDKGALVLFSKRFEDYPLAVVNYEGKQAVECRSPIWGDGLENVSITGPGTFDAQGDCWRVVKKNKVSAEHWKELIQSGGVVNEGGSEWYPSAAAKDGQADLKKLRESDRALDVSQYPKFRELLRPSLMLMSNCRHLILDGPTFKNSPNWNLHLLLCDDVTVQNITIFNPAYAQNGDGIDIDSCRNVVLKDSNINAGDDGICLKSGRDEEGRKRGRPTENVTIDHCTVGHAHGGFVIGSEMSGGVRNITVTNCTFTGTDNGLRFKSTRGRGGTVENIKVSNITMNGIQDDAITFDMYYMVKAKAAATSQPIDDGTPVFKHFQISDITCKGAKKAILIRGLPEMPIEDISLSNVQISADQGVSLIDAKKITFNNVHVDCKTDPMETKNVQGFKTH
jgi:DNA sulfur modification protein DndE